MIDFKLAKDMNINAFFGEKGVCDCNGEHYLPELSLYSFGGASEKLSEVVEELCPVGKILIVAAEDVAIYANEVENRLLGLNTERFVIPDNAVVSAELMEKLIVPEEARLILVVGGGTATDIGKIIAKTLNVPLVIYLTSLSFDTLFESDVEIWRSFVLTKEKGAYPNAVIVDHDVIAESPDEFFASAIGLAATEYMTVFDCYTREKFLKTKVCPHLIDMLISGAEKVISSAEEIKNCSRLAIEHFTDGMLKMSAARALMSTDLTNSVNATMRALFLLNKRNNKSTMPLYGTKSFELFLKIVNVISLFYETKMLEETLPPDMDYRYEQLTEKLGINEWAAYKITSQLVSPSAYLHIKKMVDENREYFADGIREMQKLLPKAIEAYKVFECEIDCEEKEDIYTSLVCSTEVCGSFTTLTIMKYLGLLERYDGKRN